MAEDSVRSQTKETIAKHIRDYFNDTTVHGFAYVVHGRNWLEKLFWIVLILTGFIMSGELFYSSCLGWNDTPLQTTIEKVDIPVQNYPFPAVTVCDHGQLQMPQRNRWMFTEQVLNWIHIGRLESNGSPTFSTRKAENDFQLNSIRKELGNVLERFVFKPFRKSCFLEYAKSCGRILEFLVLDGEANLNDNLKLMYDEVLRRWDESYPDRQCTKRHDVMKKDMLLVYDRLFKEKHQIHRSKLTLNEIDNLLNISLSNGKSCKNTKNCVRSLNKTMDMWRRLDKRIQLGRVCKLGNLVSNFNFLLKDPQQLHRTLHEVFARIYPNLLVKGLAFNDFIALLGYHKDTDFTSVSDLFDAAILQYKDTIETLHPLHSFDERFGQFKGLTDEPFRYEKNCNLRYLYQEWLNYYHSERRSAKQNHAGKILFIKVSEGI